VTATEVVSGGTGYFAEELGPLVFKFLLILMPFAILGTFGQVSKRRIVALVFVAGSFWALYLLAVSRSVGGFNFGLAFLAFLSPLLIGALAIAVDRLFTPRGVVPTRRAKKDGDAA